MSFRQQHCSRTPYSTGLRQNFSPTLHLPFAFSMPRGKPRGRQISPSMEMTDVSTAARQPPLEPPRPRSIVDGILRNYLRSPLVQPKQQDYEVLTEQAVRYLLHESMIDTPLDTKRAFLEARGFSDAQIVDAVKCAAARGDEAHANKSATQGFATPTPKGYATQALANATPCVPSVALKSASQRRKERKQKAARGDDWRQPRLGAWLTSAPRVIGYKVTISKGSCQG